MISDIPNDLFGGGVDMLYVNNNKIPPQIQTHSHTKLISMKSQIHAERQHLVEEARKKRQTPIVKKSLDMPNFKKAHKQIVEWHKRYPTYVDDLEKEEEQTIKRTIHTTRNETYVIHQDYANELTEEQRINIETNPDIINAYLD